MPFFCLFGQNDFPDKVKFNVDLLPSVTAGFIRLMNDDLADEGAYDFCIQLGDAVILAYQVEETSGIVVQPRNAVDLFLKLRKP